MYSLMPIPYSYDALKPNLNEEVVETHYTSHHQKYLDNLNKAIQNNPIYPIEEIPKNIEKYPLQDRGDILYNAGGVLNHNLYWNSLSKNKNNPTGKLLNKINLQYGNFENFRKDFTQRAKNLVGSGYTFLASNNRGDLIIVNMINQETPLSYNLIPLFTIDLWEHAYYLQYKNNRDDYIKNFWEKANFDYASNKYEEIVS